MEWLEDNLFWVQLLLTRTFGSFAAFYAGAVRYIPVGCTVQVHGKCWPRVCLFWVWIRINYSFQAKKDHPLFAKKNTKQSTNFLGFASILIAYCSRCLSSRMKSVWVLWAFLAVMQQSFGLPASEVGGKGWPFRVVFLNPHGDCDLHIFCNKKFCHTFPQNQNLHPPHQTTLFLLGTFLGRMLFFSPS